MFDNVSLVFNRLSEKGDGANLFLYQTKFVIGVVSRGTEESGEGGGGKGGGGGEGERQTERKMKKIPMENTKNRKETSEGDRETTSLRRLLFRNDPQWPYGTRIGTSAEFHKLVVVVRHDSGNHMMISHPRLIVTS